MTPDEILNLKDTEADHLILRQEVTRLFDPGPWKHHSATPLRYGEESEPWFCMYCRQEVYDTDNCPVPPPAEGSWADLAERLMRATVPKGIGYVAASIYAGFQKEQRIPCTLSSIEWFTYVATAWHRCKVLLAAAKEARK